MKLRWLLLLPAAVAVGAVAVLALSPRQSCGCALPPKLDGVADTPAQWRDAVSAGHTSIAWQMLSSQARARYRDESGLAAALPDLAARMRAGGTWRTAAMITGGAGTDTSLVDVLVDDDHRLVTAIVVHTRADGSRDGTVDPDPGTGLQIIDPSTGGTVPVRPRLRATGGPNDSLGLQYAAIGPDYSVHPGAVGAIRDPDGYDAPFDGGDLPAGSTLIVAAYRSGDRWQVAAVTVLVALSATRPIGQHAS